MNKLFTSVSISIFALLFHPEMTSQVLHTENFNVVIDTSKVVKGNFTPSFRFRNLKDDFLEISNTADVSIRIDNHAFTIANRVEYSFFGNDDILSGGFLYLEYMNLLNKEIAFEPFVQVHWNEVRGLKEKYASGLNLRWRALEKESTGLFFAVGGFYEYERWGYSGVNEENRPGNTSPVDASLVRANSYISFKQKFGTLFDLDVSGYYQPELASPSNYRLASSFELTYNITKFLGLRLLYQNIYDPSPLVPIDNLYHDINFGITLTF